MSTAIVKNWKQDDKNFAGAMGKDQSFGFCVHIWGKARGRDAVVIESQQ